MGTSLLLLLAVIVLSVHTRRVSMDITYSTHSQSDAVWNTTLHGLVTSPGKLSFYRVSFPSVRPEG